MCELLFRRQYYQTFYVLQRIIFPFFPLARPFYINCIFVLLQTLKLHIKNEEKQCLVGLISDQLIIVANIFLLEVLKKRLAKRWWLETALKSFSSVASFQPCPAKRKMIQRKKYNLETGKNEARDRHTFWRRIISAPDLIIIFAEI